MMQGLDKDVSLAVLHTFKSPVKAAYFQRFSSCQSLASLIPIIPKGFPPLILGGGSNIVFFSNPKKTILLNEIKGIERVKENKNHIWIRIGAGEHWDSLIVHCLKNGWYGLENLSYIPGKVGAAPIQNIGAYGVELDAYFQSCQYYDFDKKKTHVFNKKDCNMGYRTSIFKYELKNKGCLLTILLKLNKNFLPKLDYKDLKDLAKNDLTANKLRNIIIKIRQKKLPDPNKTPNAGSFFKNPILPEKAFKRIKENFPEMVFFKKNNEYKISAAWLIQQSSIKKTTDHIELWKHQPLVIVAKNKAKGEDIYTFSKHIEEKVFDKFAIRLEREVNIYQ